jgi:transcriptional regulator with XRE-family HTH domain
MLKEYLKQYRIKNNVTQKEMAKKLDTAQGYYSQIETGVKKPGFKFINKLASVLGVEPSFIRSLL